MDDFFFDGIDESVIRRERAKAKDLRKTNWWKTKLSRGLCHYCGQETPASKLTMDHVLPLARGGTSSKSNLVASCKDCNTKKKTMLPQEWDEYMDTLDKQGRDDKS